MKSIVVKRILKENKENYNLLAQDFDRTRLYFPEDLKEFVNEVKEGERVLDLGCGNGRLYLGLKDKKIDYFGIDNSEKLIEIAKKKFPQANFQVGNALSLNFPNNFFDKVFCIAVFHHIPSKEMRQKFLKEILRVLKPNGLLYLRVWNLWQVKKARKYILKHLFLKLLFLSSLDFFDIYYPWKMQKDKKIVWRYFHCFFMWSLKKEVKKAGFKIKRAFKKNQNFYVIGRK